MSLLINYSKLKGEIGLPSSKSLSIRALILASLLPQTSTINNLLICDDTKTVLELFDDIGIHYKLEKTTIKIKGKTFKKPLKTLNFKSSATLLRMYLPILVYLFNEVYFTANGDLLDRPIYENLDFLNFKKISKNKYNATSNTDFKLIEITPKITSQVLSGLLFLLILNNDLKIKINGKIKSESYFYLTLNFLESFFINYIISNNVITINKNNKTSKIIYKVEPDLSILPFYLILSKKHDIKINNFDINKKYIQKDYELINLIKTNKEFIFDFSNHIDSAPLFCIFALFFNKKSYIKNIETLKYKESNRLKSLLENIKKTGNITYENNSLIISGPIKDKEVTFNCYNDHRIIFTFTLLSLIKKTKTKLINIKNYEKSYPNFFNDLKKIGGKLNDK